ncbi:MAG: hypothetical protein RIQ62_745 [Bacteroidota bacterium]
MIKENPELKALFHLLDDPDRDVYHTVSDKLIHYGKEVIAPLEDLWETTMDNRVQERIEHIIHKVNFNDVFKAWSAWARKPKSSLLSGALLMSAYRYPDLDEAAVHKTIKSIYQSCWLEINNYLTPLEQINIINSIFYNMYKFKGQELEENKPAHYFLNEVLDTRQGNNYSLGLLYQILCEMLDIPVYAIQLPKQYILAYYDTLNDFYDREKQPIHKIQFYIDPNHGMIYTQNDVDVFVKKYNIKVDQNTFRPLAHTEIMYKNLEALMQVYQLLEDEERAHEIHQLMEVVAHKS